MFLRILTAGICTITEEEPERFRRTTPGRSYAVIHEGRDPVTGKEIRRWHPAGTDRSEAEKLAAKLAAEEITRLDAVRSLTFGAYLTSQWLPAKKLHLATSTYRGYEHNGQRHVLPVLGRTSIRRVRYQRSSRSTSRCSTRRPVAVLRRRPVHQIHLVIRDRRRGRSPRIRPEGAGGTSWEQPEEGRPIRRNVP